MNKIGKGKGLVEVSNNYLGSSRKAETPSLGSVINSCTASLALTNVSVGDFDMECLTQFEGPKSIDRYEHYCRIHET
jgi:hypothetical protein